MSDFALKYSGEFFDLIVDKNDIKKEDGLESAVAVSLFTDKRVRVEELPIHETDRAGWWGDTVADLERDEIGSKLWLLAREKQTNETLKRAEEYTTEALAWLIEDGVASAVSVEATYPEREALRLEVAIQKPQGRVVFTYNLNWKAQAAKGA